MLGNFILPLYFIFCAVEDIAKSSAHLMRHTFQGKRNLISEHEKDAW